MRKHSINVASPHGDARVVVAGPAHGDVYRDGWRREEVLTEPQGRFGELVETLGGWAWAQQWPQRMVEWWDGDG